MTVTTKVFVLYHANCLDGTAAAYAASVGGPSVWGDLEVKYIPVQYGQPIPTVVYGEANMVYILDFSYKRDEMIDLNSRVWRLKVLDHHETARKELEGLDFAEFSNEHSGAVMAWKYFNTTPVPDVILNIEDRDLWKFLLPDTKKIFSGLMVKDVLHDDFLKPDSVMARYCDPGITKQELDELCLAGDIVNDFRNNEIKSLGHKNGKVAMGLLYSRAVMGEEPLKVGVYNATSFISESGNLVCNSFDVDCSMSYFITNDGTWVFDLRSLPGKVNVGEVAKAFGGGGHANAAGFSIREIANGARFLAQVLHLPYIP